MHTNFDSAIKEFFVPLSKDGYSLVGYDISELTKDYYGYHLTYKRKVNDFISIEFSFDFISGHSKEEYMNILAVMVEGNNSVLKCRLPKMGYV